MKKVLITGSSGLVGSHLVKHLLENKYTVIGLSKTYPTTSSFLSENSNNYIPITADILNYEETKKQILRYEPDYIIHLAAQAIVADAYFSTQHTFDTNIKGTWNVLEAAKCLISLKKIIIASSDKAYGTHDTLPYREDFALNAVYPYDLSKKISEELALSYYVVHKLPVIITRSCNVFGPYDRNFSRLIPETIDTFLKGGVLKLRGNGLQTRSYIYGEDVADAYLKLLERNSLIGQAYNIGTTNAYSVIDIIKKIAHIMNVSIKERLIIGDMERYEIIHQSLDCSKIKRDTGWEAMFELDFALEKTVSWYTNLHNKGIR